MRHRIHGWHVRRFTGNCWAKPSGNRRIRIAAFRGSRRQLAGRGIMPDDILSIEQAASADAPATSDTPVISGNIPVGRLPCPYQQARGLQQALSSDKMRVAFFLGAGCPVSIRVADGDGTHPLIPNIEGLTDALRAKIQTLKQHKEHFAKILRHLDDSTTNKRTIEDILTQVRHLLMLLKRRPTMECPKKRSQLLTRRSV